MKTRNENIRTKHIYISLFIGLFFTISVGSLFLWMGAQNNNNGEYFDIQTGAWDIPYAALQFVVPGIMGLCIAMFLFFLLHTFSVFKKRFKDIKSYPCPSCGFLTTEENSFGSYNICPICNWEDDQVQLANPTSGGGANKESLATYQEKIITKIGLDIKECKGYSRDKNWRPLSKIEIETAEVDKATKHWSNKGITDLSEAYWMKNPNNKITFEKQPLAFEAEPNTAEPKVQVEGKDLKLTFPTWDKEGIVLFKDCLMYRVGSPNDEGFYGFGFDPKIKNDSMYSKKEFPNLEFGDFYRVIGYDWKEGLVGSGVSVIDNDFMNKEGYSHFVFFMKDGTFECVSKTCQILDN